MRNFVMVPVPESPVQRRRMKRARSTIAVSALAAALVLSGHAANAGELDRETNLQGSNISSNLTATQQQALDNQKKAVDAWKSPKNASSAPILATAGSVASSGNISTAAATYSRMSKLYRGSWLMWAEERVDFRYNGSKVVSSSGYQSSGAIFPNNVTRNGTKRITNTNATHSWRGQYTVGAGVPTPWGNANVYNATSTARTDVKRSGAWSAWWVG